VIQNRKGHSVTVATVSAKGQIILPVEARRALGIKPYGRVVIEVLPDCIRVAPAPAFFELRGFLGKALPPEQERRRMRASSSRRSGARS
jgi:AbrB family looped-hinge helix DNA binding protein